MIIQEPVILRENGKKSEYDVLIKNFVAYYNQDKESGEQLKEPHIFLMHECYYYGQINLRKDTFGLKKDGCINTQPADMPIRINLSAYLEAHKNNRSVATMKRRIKRLKEAGFISSKKEDFERWGISKKKRSDVLIMGDFTLIYDNANPDYQPISPYFSETDLQALNKMKGANCTTVSGSRLPQEQSNRIMDVDNVDKGVLTDVQPSLPEHDLTPDTTTKQAGLDQKNKQKFEKNAENVTPESVNTAAPQPQEQSSARPAVENAQNTNSLAEMKHSYARTFYIYLIQKLFATHNIYDGETQKAIAYLVQTYFSTIKSEHQARYLLSVYKKRVDMAASYIKRKNFDFSNIYPCAYLSVENPKGFTATKQWLHDNLGYKAAQAKLKQEYAKKLEEKKVMQQLQNQYNEKQSLAEVNRAIAFLNTNLPHKTNEYVQYIDNQR